ncbi:alpha-parvin isoform X5 [Pelodiscus sinensis]|uniref:alpha-parvin isoform X5 n=1 Tax=Pelodiscus sinensis TaxID=13735 RepID=UPI003F6AE7E2
MAASPQKSPPAPKSPPTPKSPPSRKKDDSFLGKLGGTLARRKKAKEVSELQEEGINAINLPLSPIPFELDPEDTMLEENEVRTMIDPNSRSDPKLQELMKVLIDWINDVLAGERIIVKDLAEDMYDGQVLQKLFEKLECEKLNVAEVTQSEIAQKQKLQTVLEKINETLKLPPRSIKWNVDTVHAKSLVAILRLLVALSQYFRAPIRLPDHVSIQVVVVQKREGILQSRQIQEEITGNTEALSGRHERDAFDTLFDHAPDKLNVVKKTLITFVNKHLNKLNLEVTELETQFADGVYLVLLMGLLEGYFVPLHSFFLTPDSFEQKVVNVSFSFELMQDGGLEKPKPRPEGGQGHQPGAAPQGGPPRRPGRCHPGLRRPRLPQLRGGHRRDAHPHPCPGTSGVPHCPPRMTYEGPAWRCRLLLCRFLHNCFATGPAMTVGRPTPPEPAARPRGSHRYWRAQKDLMREHVSILWDMQETLAQKVWDDV